jgi:mRNA interferase MazF
MVIARGEVWWADLGEPRGSEPAYERPVVVLQSDAFNRTRLATVIIVSMTSNARAGLIPGNVLVRRRDSGLPHDSVVVATQVATVNRAELLERVGRLPDSVMNDIDDGIRLVLEL